MDRKHFITVLAMAVAVASCSPPAGDGFPSDPITQAISWPEGGFHPCRFNFGAAWQGTAFNYPAGPNYTSLWLGDKDNWNEFWEGEFLRSHWPGQKLYGRTPLFYSYVIAFTARREKGLKDCDTGSPNLCEQGANFVRQNEATILDQYRKYATNTARIWGKDNPVIWLMEPDYFQYNDNRQQGGGMSYEQLGTLMGKILNVIAAELPNAVFSMDISPWAQNPQAWFAAMPVSKFSFINTSGGRTDADSDKIRNENNMKWRDISALTKLRIIADDGYGVGGGSLGHDSTWDNINNLKSRMADGVVSITQGNPRGDWNTIIAGLKPQLGTVPNCTATTIAMPAPLPGSGGASGMGGMAAGTGGKAAASGGASGQSGQSALGQGGGAMAAGGSAGSDQGGVGGQTADEPAVKDGNANKFFGIGCAFGSSHQRRPKAGLLGLLGILLAVVSYQRSRH